MQIKKSLPAMVVDTLSRPLSEIKDEKIPVILDLAASIELVAGSDGWQDPTLRVQMLPGMKTPGMFTLGRTSGEGVEINRVMAAQGGATVLGYSVSPAIVNHRWQEALKAFARKLGVSAMTHGHIYRCTASKKGHPPQNFSIYDRDGEQVNCETRWGCRRIVDIDAAFPREGDGISFFGAIAVDDTGRRKVLTMTAIDIEKIGEWTDHTNAAFQIAVCRKTGMIAAINGEDGELAVKIPGKDQFEVFVKRATTVDVARGALVVQFADRTTVEYSTMAGGKAFRFGTVIAKSEYNDGVLNGITTAEDTSLGIYDYGERTYGLIAMPAIKAIDPEGLADNF